MFYIFAYHLTKEYPSVIVEAGNKEKAVEVALNAGWLDFSRCSGCGDDLWDCYDIGYPDLETAARVDSRRNMMQSHVSILATDRVNATQEELDRMRDTVMQLGYRKHVPSDEDIINMLASILVYTESKEVHDE
jgi:hypothetical protein